MVVTKMMRSISLAIVALCMAAILWHVVTSRRSPLEACAESQLRMQARASLRWNPPGSASDDGPSREDWAQQLHEDGLVRRELLHGLPGCLESGRIEVKPGKSGALNVHTTYRAQCSRHGDMAAIRKTMGETAFKAFEANLKTHLSMSGRGAEGIAIEI